MASLVSVSDVFRLAQIVYSLCQEAETNRGALQEARLKVAVVHEIIADLPADAACQEALQQVYAVLRAMHDTVSKTYQMKRFMYTRKAKDITNEIRSHTNDLQFYMNSLQLSQTSVVFKKLMAMDVALDAVEEKDDLRQKLEKERKQQQELNSLLRSQQASVLDVDELCRQGWIESTDEVIELIQQMMQEHDRLVANHEKNQAAVKDRMEAEHLAQMIEFLEQSAVEQAKREQQAKQTASDNQPEKSFRTDILENIVCPITSEVMHDPVIVDGVDCKCCMSREAFEGWQEVSKQKTCPLCRGPLRSNRISPNVHLAEIVALVNGQRTSSVNAVEIPVAAVKTETCVPSVTERNNLLLPDAPLSTATPPPAQMSQVVQPVTKMDEQNVNKDAVDLFFGGRFKGHEGFVWCCAAYKNGRRMLSGGADRVLSVWDTETGAMLLKLEGHDDTVSCCVSLDEDRKAVSGSNDTTLKIWDVESEGGCIQTLSGHSGKVCCCVSLQDDSTIVSGSEDKTLKIWDWKSGHCIHTFVGHTSDVLCCVALYGGGKLVSGSADRTLKIWDIDTANCVQTLRGHTRAVTCCCDLDDDRRIVSGSFDTTMRIWDVFTGACVWKVRAHSDNIRSCIALCHGETLVTCSDDRQIKVWDVESGRCAQKFSYSTKVLAGHNQFARCLAVVDDDGIFVSGGNDKSLRLWGVREDHASRFARQDPHWKKYFKSAGN